MLRLTCLALIVTQVLLTACDVDRPAVRPDGTLAIGGKGKLLVANFDEGWRREIPMPTRDDSQCDPLWPAWSADGRTLAFVCEGDTLGVADVESGRVRLFEHQKLHPEFDEIYLPSWSPRDRTVTWVSFSDEEDRYRTELHALTLAKDLSQEDHRVLYADLPLGPVHAWFPDGKSIALMAGRQKVFPEDDEDLPIGHLARLSLESGELERLAAVAFLGINVIEVAQDGSQVFFSTPARSLPSLSFSTEDDFAGFELWRLELAPRTLTRITRAGEPASYFACSPSGRRVLYEQGNILEGDEGIYVWGEGFPGHRQVQGQDDDEFLPVWLDENRVVYREDGHYHVIDLRTFESQDVTEALLGEAGSGEESPAEKPATEPAPTPSSP